MPEKESHNGGEWSWTHVVLAKSSRSIAAPKQKEPENLSTCLDRRSAGQVDRLVCTFKSPTTLGAGDARDGSEVSHSKPTPDYRDSEQTDTADIWQPAELAREIAAGCARLPPERPPGDVPLSRWHLLINDIAYFVRDGWADKAAVFGWTLSDLVGSDPERLFALLEKAGLLWLLGGNRLVAISDKTATIEASTGAKQTYRRKPNEPGRTPAWDLIDKIQR